MKKIIRFFIARWAERKLKKLIARANKLRRLTGYKFVILNVAGKPVLIRKADVKQEIKQRKIIGLKISNIEKNAIYVTV